MNSQDFANRGHRALWGALTDFADARGLQTIKAKCPLRFNLFGSVALHNLLAQMIEPKSSHCLFCRANLGFLPESSPDDLYEGYERETPLPSVYDEAIADGLFGFPNWPEQVE